MDEKEKPTNNPTASNPEDVNKDAKKGDDNGSEQQKNEDKSFKQEDVDRIVSERLAKAKSKSEKEFIEMLKKEREDWERQSKLSQEEKEKEISRKQAEELERKEKDITLRENKLNGIQKLNELEVPIEFVDLLVDLDSEVMDEKINNFANRFKKAVADGIAKATSNSAPKDPSSSSNATTEPKKGSNFF